MLPKAEVDQGGGGGSDEKRKLSVLLLRVVHSFHCWCSLKNALKGNWKEIEKIQVLQTIHE